MSAPRPVLIMAGGTGGHIFPGLAVARALQRHGVPVHWLGSRSGLESELVAKAQFPFHALDVQSLRGKNLLGRLSSLTKLLKSIFQAKRAIAGLLPQAIVSFGGFAAGPGGIAAAFSAAPLLVHEQNAVPGLTNRVLAVFAKKILVSFDAAFHGRANTILVGNPVRDDIAALPRPEQRLHGREGALRILVLGGSQGAQALNRAVPHALGAMVGEAAFEVRHQSGKKGQAETAALYEGASIVAKVEAFIDDMAQAYAWADLVICRAGASTLAELCAVGVASVLVPYPHAADDHQSKNAQYLVDHGAGVFLREGALLADELGKTLADLLAGGREKLLAVAIKARALAQPDAAARIAKICLDEGGR